MYSWTLCISETDLRLIIFDPLNLHLTHLYNMSSSSSQAVNSPASQLQSSLQTLTQNYSTTTPSRVKLIDSFLFFLLLSGILQFSYRILITSYPYNAFLGGYVLLWLSQVIWWTIESEL